jgi:hypothetical protein
VHSCFNGFIINEHYKPIIQKFDHIKIQRAWLFACGFAVRSSEDESKTHKGDAGKQADMAWIERGFENEKTYAIMPDKKRNIPCIQVLHTI